MEIILKAVSKKIGYTQVLDNINCLFLDGKIYGIVGYNGSGKTLYDMFKGLSLKDKTAEETAGADVTSFRFNLSDGTSYDSSAES